MFHFLDIHIHAPSKRSDHKLKSLAMFSTQFSSTICSYLAKLPLLLGSSPHCFKPEMFFLCDFRPIATLLPHWHRQRPTPLGFSSRKPPSPDLHLPNHRRSPPAARRHRPGRAPSPRWSAPPLFLPTTGSHLLPCRLKPQTSILARPRSPPTWDPISPCHRFLICLQIYLNQLLKKIRVQVDLPFQYEGEPPPRLRHHSHCLISLDMD